MIPSFSKALEIACIDSSSGLFRCVKSRILNINVCEWIKITGEGFAMLLSSSSQPHSPKLPSSKRKYLHIWNKTLTGIFIRCFHDNWHDIFLFVIIPVHFPPQSHTQFHANMRNDEISPWLRQILNFRFFPCRFLWISNLMNFVRYPIYIVNGIFVCAMSVNGTFRSLDPLKMRWYNRWKLVLCCTFLLMWQKIN